MTAAIQENPQQNYEELLQAFESFAHLPQEALLKQDMLRRGLRFSEDTLLISKGYKPKDYFIFSFDLIELKDMALKENFRAPEEIRFSAGPFDFASTVVSVRINPKSPYTVCIYEGNLSLFLDQSFLGHVEFHPVPAYYKTDTINKKPIGEICPVIEWGYLLYLTAYRLCQYFNQKEQCQFCDLNTNYSQQKKSGRTYTGIKSIDEILEALQVVADNDSTAKAYTLTGGSILTDLRGHSEAEFYLKYAEAINKRFAGRWIAKAVVQAWEQKDCERLKEVGIDIYHPNYEVWGKELFAKICPGKERFIGFENWVERILQATHVFGAKNVIPNFVAGVEMNSKTGFTDTDTAIASTTEGLEYFMSHGVVPRFTTWCPEPLAALGPQKPAPLEYYAKLLTNWKKCFEKYKLPVPPGYGEPGVGKAVFSVSAFMDVIEA